jgi:hypothetical protein
VKYARTVLIFMLFLVIYTVLLDYWLRSDDNPGLFARLSFSSKVVGISLGSTTLLAFFLLQLSRTTSQRLLLSAAAGWLLWSTYISIIGFSSEWQHLVWSEALAMLCPATILGISSHFVLRPTYVGP